MNTDKTPTIDEFRPVVLRVLSNSGTLPVREICEQCADYMGLDEDVRSERIPSGQARYVNRVNWACSALTQAGLLRRPKRGHYEITEHGRQVDQRNLTSYTEKDMLEWPVWRSYQEEIASRRTDDSNALPPQSDEEETRSPIEVMAQTEQTFNYKLETELRSRLQQASPEFFEKAVIDLLWAMGYGGSRGKKRHVGRSHDGGIDGIISQDALGLTNVYIQAKRYSDSNRVGTRDMRDFMGALSDNGANLGVEWSIISDHSF